MTQNYSKQDRIKILKNSIMVALGVLLIFGLGGKYIFMIFNINVNVFKIAGSILLFKVSFDKTEKSSTLLDQLMVIVAIFITMILSYFLLLSSNVFFKYLGRTGNLVISRIMGLILASISIEFIFEGIKDLIINYL